MTKRAEIEIDETIVVSATGTDTLTPPPVCAGWAMVTPEEEAALTRVTARGGYARVEAGSVHLPSRTCCEVYV